MNWQELMKYPNLIESYQARNGTYEELFDTLQELIPIDDKGNRFTTFFHWIDTAIHNGLITKVEKMNIQTYLIHGYGGF